MDIYCWECKTYIREGTYRERITFCKHYPPPDYKLPEGIKDVKSVEDLFKKMGL